MDAFRVVDTGPLLVRAAGDAVGLVHDRKVERRNRVPGLAGLLDLVQGVVGTDHRQRGDLVLLVADHGHQRGQGARVGGRHDVSGDQVATALHVHGGDDHHVLEVTVAAPRQRRLRGQIEGGHDEQDEPRVEFVRQPDRHQRLAGARRRHVQGARSGPPQMTRQPRNSLGLVGEQPLLLRLVGGGDDGHGHAGFLNPRDDGSRTTAAVGEVGETPLRPHQSSTLSARHIIRTRKVRYPYAQCAFHGIALVPEVSHVRALRRGRRADRVPVPAAAAGRTQASAAGARPDPGRGGRGPRRPAGDDRRLGVGQGRAETSATRGVRTPARPTRPPLPGRGDRRSHCPAARGPRTGGVRRGGTTTCEGGERTRSRPLPRSLTRSGLRGRCRRPGAATDACCRALPSVLAASGRAEGRCPHARWRAHARAARTWSAAGPGRRRGRAGDRLRRRRSAPGRARQVAARPGRVGAERGAVGGGAAAQFGQGRRSAAGADRGGV